MFLHQGTYIRQHAGASFSRANISTHLLSLDSVEEPRESEDPRGSDVGLPKWSPLEGCSVLFLPRTEHVTSVVMRSLQTSARSPRPFVLLLESMGKACTEMPSKQLLANGDTGPTYTEEGVTASLHFLEDHANAWIPDVLLTWHCRAQLGDGESC